MMNYLKRASLLLLILIVTVFIIYESFFSYYPEKFMVNNVEVRLFEVTSQDTVSKCFRLEDYSGENMPDKLLLGIRLELEYLSLRHEFFFEDTHKPYGAFGHTDTLKDIKISLQKLGGKEILLTDSLSNGSNYRLFLYDENQLWEHSIVSGSQSCYLANVLNDVNELVIYYNNHEYKNVGNLRNYFLFEIPTSLVHNTKDYKRQLTLIFSDGRLIHSNW